MFKTIEEFALPDDDNDLEAILDCITRWNSTYVMLDRALTLKDALVTYVASRNVKDAVESRRLTVPDGLTLYDLARIDWAVVEKFVQLFRPMVEDLLRAGSKDFLISHVYPIVANKYV